MTIKVLSDFPMSPDPVADDDLLYIIRVAFPEGTQSESISIENLRVAMGGNPKLNQIVRARYGTLDKLLSGITAELIVDGQIVTSKLANLAVTGPKLGPGAVTKGKIAAGAVTAAKLDSTVTELITSTVDTAIAAIPAPVVSASNGLPDLPDAGSRDNKVAKFDGDVLGWEADAVGTVTPVEKLLPDLPTVGSRDNKIPKFDGDVLGWEADAVGTVTPVEKLLPDLPTVGSRDNKIPKFDGDVLGWEADAVGVAGGGLNEDAVDARVKSGVEDWAETGNIDDIPDTKISSAIARTADIPGAPDVDPIIIGTLPDASSARPASFYGSGSTYADSIYYPKRVTDRTHIILEAAIIGTTNAALIGFSLTGDRTYAPRGQTRYPARVAGLVHRPWRSSLGITKLYVKEGVSVGTMSVVLETASATTAQSTGFILYGLAISPITLFRVAGTPDTLAIYRSADTTVAPIVNGGIYRLQLRYSGGQSFINVHDRDFFAEVATTEDIAESEFDDAVRLDSVRARVTTLENTPPEAVDLGAYYTKTQQGRIDDALELSIEKSDEAIRDVVVTRTTADDVAAARQFKLPGSTVNEAIAIVGSPTLLTGPFAASFAAGSTGHSLALTASGQLFAKLLNDGQTRFYRVRCENTALGISFLLPGSDWRFHTKTNLHSYYKIEDTFDWVGYTLTMEYLANATDKPNSTYYGIPERVEEWSIKGDSTAIPADKLTNVPASTAGLNQDAVDARVKVGVSDWAEATNTDLIPSSKLPPGGDLKGDLLVTWTILGGTYSVSQGWDSVPRTPLISAAGTALGFTIQGDSVYIAPAVSHLGYIFQVTGPAEGNTFVPSNFTVNDTTAITTAINYIIVARESNIYYGFKQSVPRDGRLTIAPTVSAISRDRSFSGITVFRIYAANAGAVGAVAPSGATPATWAVDGNTDDIPSSKLGQAGANPLTWATVGDTSSIPANKLSLAGADPLDWATVANTDKIPDNKIPANIARAMAKSYVQTSGNGSATVSGNNTRTRLLTISIVPSTDTSKVLLEISGGITQIGVPGGNTSSGGVGGTYSYEVNRSGKTDALINATTQTHTRAYDGERKEGALSQAFIDSPGTTSRITYTLDWGASGGYTFTHTNLVPIVMILTEMA